MDLTKDRMGMIIPSVNQGFISVYDNALSDNWCDDTIRLFNTLETKYGDQFPSETDDPHVNHNFNNVSHRRDKCRFFQSIADEWDKEDREENIRLTKTFFDTIEEYKNQYLKQIGLGLGKLEPDCMKIHYNDIGSHFSSWHHEYSGTNERYKSRVLVYMVNMTDYAPGDEGSGTEFLFQGLRIPPKKGQMIIFPADFTHTHRGNPNYHGERYFATGWWLSKSGNGTY